MKSYCFRLYNHKRNRYLKRTVNCAAWIYNHCISLHRRYYRVWKKHLNVNHLMKHIAKLRKRNERWKILNSQSVQDICQRIDRAYKRFFQDKRSGRPGYKKKVKYKSFTLKQTGYKLFENNRIRIGKKVYKYWKSRDIQVRNAPPLANRM